MVDGRIAFGETHLFVGRRLCGLRPPRRLDLLHAGARALRGGPEGVLGGGGLHPLCHSRLHRRQLHAGDRDDPGGGGGDRGQHSGRERDRGPCDAALSASARSPAPAQCRRSRWSRSAAVSSSRDCRASIPSMSPLFRDVSDHIRRVQEEIESLREVLAFAFETSLMTGQAQQTEITRKLAAWAAILAVPTAVAGLYGMNFDVHARAALEIRLRPRARGHPGGMRLAVLALPPEAVALGSDVKATLSRLHRAAAKGWPHGGIPRLGRPWNAAHPSRSRSRLHTR